MFKWFINKTKRINTVLDIGIILTIVTGFLTILIYSYKICLLHLIGVPFSIFLNIIDVKFIDYLIFLPIIFLVLLFGIFCYYTFYIKSFCKKIRNCFLILILLIILGIISIHLNFLTIDELITIIVFFFIAYILSPFFIGTFLQKPNDITSKIFHSKNEKNKLIVFTMEMLVIFLAIICITFYLSNIRIAFPTQITLANAKIIIYSSQDALLVSDYKINSPSNSIIKEINIDFNTLEITNKEKKYILTKEKYIIK